MRELVKMAHARIRHDWDQTALMWATQANSARDPKKHPRAFSPGDVHPLRTAKDYQPKPIQADITVLKQLLKMHDGK